MSVLEVRNLRVRFDTPRGSVQAVDSISFELDAGETLALVGESGSGKSATALALLSLLPRPPAVVETGEAWFGGRDLLTLSSRELQVIRGREIGYVFQDPTSSLHPLMTIGAQLCEVLAIHEHLPRQQARQRAVAALAEVCIPEPEARLSAFPHELSGGMRQRAMIAMALLCRPKVLIADEPTTALDVTVQAQILDLLRELQQRHGTAILWITHDLALVAGFADRVSVMYAGSIVESAATRELFARPAHPYTLGLLRSIPSLTSPTDAPLESIAGSPPDPTQTIRGCAFHPRCAFRAPMCIATRPALSPVSRGGDPQSAAASTLVTLSGRRVACFEAGRVLAASASQGARTWAPT